MKDDNFYITIPNELLNISSSNDYFKNNLDSIKNFHIKVNNKENNKSNLKNNDDYTIYFEDNIYYAVKDNDITTYKHLTMFSISEILHMNIGPNIDKNNLVRLFL